MLELPKVRQHIHDSGAGLHAITGEGIDGLGSDTNGGGEGARDGAGGWTVGLGRDALT